MSVNSKMTAIANAIRTLLGTAGTYTLDTMATAISGITRKAAATYTPTTADQTIAAGQYLSGAQTVKGDANLLAGNIASGVSIFGVAGSHAGQKTEQSKTVTPTAAGLTVYPDSGMALSSVVVSGDADLAAGNIRKNVEIFGVTGTYEGSTSDPYELIASGSAKPSSRVLTISGLSKEPKIIILYFTGTNNVGSTKPMMAAIVRNNSGTIVSQVSLTATVSISDKFTATTSGFSASYSGGTLTVTCSTSGWFTLSYNYILLG